jgi:subtilisin family serine protease
MFSIKSFLATAVALLTLTTGLATPGVAAEPPGLDTARSAAREHGTARVIVSLRPPSGAAALDVATSDFVRRSAVARTAELFLGRQFGSTEAARQRGARRAVNLPIVVFEATAADLARLADDPSVERIHLDTPDRRTLDQSTALIGMPAVWAAGGDGGTTVVAVLDTGVSSSHMFMAGKVVGEACFSVTQSASGYSSTSVCPNGQNSQTGPGSGVNCSVAQHGDGCQHGTHVAGIVAGANSMSTPRSGVARAASIYSIQVFSYFPAFQDVLSWTSDQILALDHVYSQRDALAPKRIVAVNMSLGGGSYATTCPTDPRRAVVQLLRGAGIVVVAAAGNDGLTNGMGTPACIPEVVSVGSTTKSDQMSSFSNISAQTTMLAPGSAIVSSVPGNGFASFNGTSMAAPHVAGALAALADGLPTRSIDELVDALVSTGLPIPDVVHTKPRIQVAAAYQSLAPVTGALVVSPTSAVVVKRIGTSLTPTSFQVTLRASAGTVGWTLSGLPGWLRASATSGTVNTTGSPVTFTVVAPARQTTDLAATLSFRKSASSDPAITIPVTLDHVPQSLAVRALTDTTIRRAPGKKPDPAVLEVRVASSIGIANWSLTKVPSWLRPSATTGSASKTGKVVRFRVVPPDRQAKTLVGRIEFAIPGVKGSARGFTVRLNALKRPSNLAGLAAD